MVTVQVVVQDPSSSEARTEGCEFVHAVSKTAQWVGYLRVLEGEKARPLFVDPLAKALSGDESARAQCCRMSGLIDMPGWFMSPETYRELEQTYFAIRHRYIDDFVLRRLGEMSVMADKASGAGGGDKARRQLQVVNLGAGLDGRAFRLAFPPHTTVFEVDRPEVLRFKNRRIAELATDPPTSARRVCVEACLEEEGWDELLVAQGFDPALPTVWLAEGLLVYLSETDVRRLLSRVRAMSAPGSAFVADTVNRALMRAPFMQPRIAALRADGCAWKSSITRPVALLRSCGFTTARFHFVGDEEASYGRLRPSGLLRLSRVHPRVWCAVLYSIFALLLLRVMSSTYAVLAVAAPAYPIEGVLEATGAIDALARGFHMAVYPSMYLMEGTVE